MDRRKGAASAFPCHRRGRVWAAPRKRVKGLVPCGFLGQRPEPPEGLKPASYLPKADPIRRAHKPSASQYLKALSIAAARHQKAEQRQEKEEKSSFIFLSFFLVPCFPATHRPPFVLD